MAFSSNMWYSGLATISIALVLLSSCNGGKNNKKPRPDVSGIAVQIPLIRFEQEMMTQSTKELSKAYPCITEVFFSEFLGIQPDRQEIPQGWRDSLKHQFLSDPYSRELLQDVAMKFGNFQSYRKSFEEAFRFNKYYFPKLPVPDLYTCVSFFNTAAFTCGDSVLAVSLELYMGADYKFYETVEWLPRYVAEHLTPNHLLVNGMKAYATETFDFRPKNNELLAGMIAEGLQLYYLDLVLPDTPDHLKINYTEEQLQFCKDNEARIWEFFIEKDLLYGTSQMENKKYIAPGPGTAGMPEMAPGNIGSWVGWQIVRAYMKQNPGTKFQELLDKGTSQSILERSKYKPNPS